jgi:hypothetical protein
VDDIDGNITPSCNPNSGSLFPLGTTEVACTATDSLGNTAEASKKVFQAEASYDKRSSVRLKPSGFRI